MPGTVWNFIRGVVEFSSRQRRLYFMLGVFGLFSSFLSEIAKTLITNKMAKITFISFENTAVGHLPLTRERQDM